MVIEIARTLKSLKTCHPFQEGDGRNHWVCLKCLKPFLYSGTENTVCSVWNNQWLSSLVCLSGVTGSRAINLPSNIQFRVSLFHSFPAVAPTLSTHWFHTNVETRVFSYSRGMHTIYRVLQSLDVSLWRKACFTGNGCGGSKWTTEAFLNSTSFSYKATSLGPPVKGW